MRVAVLGLGNPIRRVIDGGTLGLDLLSSLSGVSHLLALDAVETATSPGTLARFADAELSSLSISKSVHLLGFVDLLDALSLLDDAPDRVVLLGIQPESTDWGGNPVS